MLYPSATIMLCHWTEDTDDETGQALKGMDSLPSILRRYVREDNRWFQQELREWEEQFCQAQCEEVHTEKPIQEDPQNPELEPKPEPAQEQTNEVSEEPSTDSTPASARDSEGLNLFLHVRCFPCIYCRYIFKCLFLPRAHGQFSSSQLDIIRPQWECGRGRWGVYHQ